MLAREVAARETADRRRQPAAVHQVGAALGRAPRGAGSTRSSCTPASTRTPSSRRSSSRSSSSREPAYRARPPDLGRRRRSSRRSRRSSRRAARPGPRLRRHELDARGRAGRVRASRSRTSRPGCAAATSRCPRSTIGSRSTPRGTPLRPRRALEPRRSQARASPANPRRRRRHGGRRSPRSRPSPASARAILEELGLEPGALRRRDGASRGERPARAPCADRRGPRPARRCRSSSRRTRARAAALAGQHRAAAARRADRAARLPRLRGARLAGPGDRRPTPAGSRRRRTGTASHA